MRIADPAADVGADKTVVVHVLDDLGTARLTMRRPYPADRRSRQIVITSRGRQAVRRSRSELDAAETELLAGSTRRSADECRAVLAIFALRTHGLADDADRPGKVS